MKFPESISSKDVVSREFLEIYNNSTFSKNEYLKSVNFLLFSSVSYNIVVVTKQIYFPLTL